MWLEIDDDLIIGVHSHKCESDCIWVEYHGDVNPGDSWKNNKVIPQEVVVDKVDEKRKQARAHIIQAYPEWKQLNILRQGTERELRKMGRFIDKCRDWSNKPNSKLSQLEKNLP